MGMTATVDIDQKRYGKLLAKTLPKIIETDEEFDRMVALLCGTTSIRDVIAFPKTQKGQDLMAQSPTPVTAKQLKELHIATVMPE